MNIFVAKLDYKTEESDVRSAFEAYGEVDSVKIIFDKFTNRSKGFGFVEMADDNEALSAIEGLDGTEIDGRTIVVKKAEQRERRDDRGGNRGGGGHRGGGGGNFNRRY